MTFDNLFQLLFRLPVPQIVLCQIIGKLHIKFCLPCIPVVFRYGAHEKGAEHPFCLPHDYPPLLPDSLQIFRSRFRWSGRFLCFGCRILLPAFDSFFPPHHRYPFFHPLFQHPDPLQDRIQIRLHRRPAQPDQRDLHQHSFLRSIPQLAGKVGKNADIPHQRFRLKHILLFQQKIHIFPRQIQQFAGIRRRFDQKQIPHIPGKIRHKLPHLFPLEHQLLQKVNDCRHIACRHLAKHTAENFRIHRTQHIQYIIIRQRLPQIKSHTLIQETERVPQGTVRSFCNIADRLFLRLNMFFFHQFHQPRSNGIDGDPPEIIPLASRKDGNGNLMRLRGGQDENNIRRRFLQCFQECVERPRRQHMNLIDNVHFIFSLRRTIRNFLPDLPYIVHSVVGRGINLNHIHGCAVLNTSAHITLIAWIAIHRMFTVDRLGQNLCHRRLPGPTRTAEQVRVADPVGFNLIF